jgi:tRNA 2-thiouridine synthesizing protein E
MKKRERKGREYLVDKQGFLLDPDCWDEEFAIALAPRLKIEGGLTEKHWAVIRYTREVFQEGGKCPSMYETCRVNGLSIRDLRHLFPTGYIRGVCKIAGLTYRDAYLKYSWAEAASRDGQRGPGR